MEGDILDVLVDKRGTVTDYPSVSSNAKPQLTTSSAHAFMDVQFTMKEYVSVEEMGTLTKAKAKEKKKRMYPDASKSLAIAISVIGDDLYNIKERCIVLLRVLTVIYELTNREGQSSRIRCNRDSLLSEIISITNIMTLNPFYWVDNNNLNSNKCSLPQLDTARVKLRLNFLKELLDEDLSWSEQLLGADPKRTFRPMYPVVTSRKKKFGDSFMTSSTKIYVARGISNLYEVISNTKNNTIAEVAIDTLEQTQKFIANGCSSLPDLFEYCSSGKCSYEDIDTHENTLKIQAGNKNKEVTISPRFKEAVETACKIIKQYSMEAGKNVRNLPLNLPCEDDNEFIKSFINYGKYCELLIYFKEDCKRLMFEGYLQTIMYSLLKFEEELCNSEYGSSDKKDCQVLNDDIFRFVDFRDDDSPVEEIYADCAMKYIHIHMKSFHNYISKMGQHLEIKHSNPDQVHKMLNISKNDYDEAKECEDLDSFITELVEGADFEVRKMAPENFYIDVNNKVYVASILLQYAVMENDSGMNMVQKFLTLNADPRVENLRDGMSAVGIALLYEDTVEEFLLEFTKRRYHLRDNKIDVNKCLISSDLRIIEDYSNTEAIMDSLKQLYYFT